jgi:NAD(P)-dependent dehydrogenase (short-subunit alcohol dehydrogenase family)
MTTGAEEIVMVIVADKTVLVTGGNRGIGLALVEEALGRGASRVYAGTRQAWTHPDRRVRPLALDVTDAGLRRWPDPRPPVRRHRSRGPLETTRLLGRYTVTRVTVRSSAALA